MNVLITGATGFLGPHLIRSAQKLGGRVSIISRSPRNFQGVSIYSGDLTIPSPQVKEAFKNQDVIFHAAVDYRSPQKTLAMMGNVLKLALSAGSPKMVFVSSQNASFQNPGGYSLAKRECEELLKARYSRWCIVRPTLIYDDGGGFLIGDLIRTARKFHLIPLPGAGASPLQPVHAEDVAEVTVKSAGLPDRTLVTVAGREVVSLKQLAECLQKNIPGSFIVTVPMRLLKWAGLFHPVIRDKARELEQVKTLTPEEEKTLSRILPGVRRSILEDLPKLLGSARRQQTKSDVFRDPGIGIEKKFPVDGQPRFVK